MYLQHITNTPDCFKRLLIELASAMPKDAILEHVTLLARCSSTEWTWHTDSPVESSKADRVGSQVMLTTVTKVTEGESTMQAIVPLV